MHRSLVFARRNKVLVAILSATLCASLAVTPAWAQTSESDKSIAGRVEFDFPKAPVATVQVDVNQGLLSAVTGIGQAAIQGVAEALLESHHGRAAVPVKESAEHLQAVNEIVSALSGVVHEIRVRVYEDLSEMTSESRDEMIAHYHHKLKGSDWDNVVRVRDDDDSVTLSILRVDDSIRGLFVVVSESDELVVANIVCDLSPERVKHVSNQSTKIGMRFGLEQAIQQAMQEIERELR